MSSTINDPFLLANYSLAKRLLHTKSSSSDSSNVHVSYTDSKLDGFATVAVQGDGIHVLDISSLHPAISHTLGPSTTFACPAVSHIKDEYDHKTCTTFAVVDSSPEVEAENSGRTIWQWKTDLDAGIGSNSGEKLSVLAPHIVSRLLVHKRLPSRLQIFSPEGALTVTDLDLNTTASIAAASQNDQLYKVFTLPRDECSFDSSASTELISVLTLKRDNSLYVRMLSVENSAVKELGIFEILAGTEIADVSCSDTGHMSVIATTGIWYSFQLQVEVEHPSLSFSNLSEPIALASLTFLASRTSAVASHEVSLQALDSSLVLLAAVPSASPTEIIVMLWDLQYSVLLTSNTFSIPATLSRSPTQGISIHLVRSTSSQVIVSLSPKLPLTETKSQYRSSVLVIPINAPTTSNIANAMGKMTDALKWISKSDAIPSNAAALSTLDPSRRGLLGKMRAAMNQNQPHVADDLFFQWFKQQQKRYADGNEPLQDSSSILGHEFVKQVIRIVLQPGKAAGGPYSPKVMLHLLEQRVVTSVMLDEGLLPTLMIRCDWPSITAAFKTVRDLRETDITRLLHCIVTVSKLSADPDAMQVDSAGKPSLASFLTLCVAYNYSAPALRLALRKHLPRVEDIICVLEVLDTWLGMYEQDVPAFLTPSDLPEAVPSSLPPLDRVLSFLQVTLDASFLVLLQYPAAHELLQKISSHIEPELKFIGEVEQLRGPLEPFVKAQKKASVQANEVLKDRQGPQEDWRRKRKQAFAQASLNIGLYQVEELII